MEITVKDLYDFKICPLRFKLTHIDKITEHTTVNDGIRDILQKVIDHYYMELMKGNQLSLKDLRELFSTLWSNTGGLYNIYTTDSQAKRKKEIECMHMLNNFYGSQSKDPDHVLATNIKFRMPFGDDFFVNGVIPVVRDTERGIEIAVHKMGNYKYDEFWQKTDMGLTLIAMAYHSMYKVQIDSIAVHALKSGDVHYVKRDRSSYKRLIKSVKFIKKCIDKDWMYPRETNACSSCSVKNICMEWK